MEMFNPPHPGEILLEEYIRPLGFSVSAFALKLGTSRKNLSEIVVIIDISGKRQIQDLYKKFENVSGLEEILIQETDE